MMTVKELSDRTGISVRTLHYYDEIGLLKPTAKSEKGYRLYDDEALERLQQILFFREFDIPLKKIKSVMDNPALEKHQILQTQKDMLILKKQRLEKLICNIDEILKGDGKMDFTAFSREEVEDIFQSMVSGMNEEQKSSLAKNYGGVDGFHEHFIGQALSEQTQKNWQKVMEWYGGKENALDAAKHPIGEEVIKAYQKRTDMVMQKLISRKKEGYPIDAFEVKEVIAEYGFMQKQLFRFQHEREYMIKLADVYESDARVIKDCDERWGEGASEYFAEAVKKFYKD